MPPALRSLTADTPTVGNLVNLGLASDIRAVERRNPDGDAYHKIAVCFGKGDNYTCFPESFPSEEAALAVINGIYLAFAV